MEARQSLEFGTRALMLRTAAASPPNEIQRLQRSRLEELVGTAREKAPFYREKFAHIDDPSFELTDLPTTTKAELMENFDRAVTVEDVRRDEVERFLADEANLGEYFRGKYVLSHTSGSQGQPLLIVNPKEYLELVFALHVARGNHRSLSIWEAVKRFVSPARLAAVILKRGFYPSGSAFEYMPDSARPFIDLLRLSMTDEDMIERLAAFRPTHLTAYTSVLHELARQIEAGRLTLQPELEQVINISERLMPQTREHYAKVFGAPILDSYSMGECMFLSNGCSTSGGMHVNADWAILEVVDEENRPVPDGTKGAKVLITNLANHVQPIIRYEIGDIVTMAEAPCGCGNNLPLIADVEGRDSDLLWIKADKGMRPLSPAVFDTALARVTDSREFQLVQEVPNRIRIRIEPLPGVKLDRDRATKILYEQLDEYELNDRLEIELETVDRLAPERGDKFERVVSKVSSAEEAETGLVSAAGRQRGG